MSSAFNKIELKSIYCKHCNDIRYVGSLFSQALSQNYKILNQKTSRNKTNVYALNKSILK